VSIKTIQQVRKTFDSTIPNSSNSFFCGFLQTFKRNIKIIWQYRFLLIKGFLSTLTVVSLYYFVSLLIESGIIENDGYRISSVSFIFVGIIIVEVTAKTITSTLGSFQSEMRQGTFEALITTQFGLKKYVYAETFAEVVYTLILNIIYYIPVFFIFPLLRDVSVTLSSSFTILLLLFFTFVFFTTLALVGANFTVLIKRGREISMVIIGTLLLLSGSLFPLSVFPNWLRTIAQISPLTQVVKAIRFCLFGQGIVTDSIVWHALLVLVAGSVILFVVFQILFKSIYKRIQHKGTFHEY